MWFLHELLDLAQHYGVLVIALLGAVLGFAFRRGAKRRLAIVEAPTGRQKLPVRVWTLVAVTGAWIFAVLLISLVFRDEDKGRFEAPEIHPKVVENVFGIHGLSISPTLLTTWGIMAVLVGLALLLRLTVLRRMKQNPKGVQLLLETMVEGLDKYVGDKLHGMSVSFGAYIFALALLLVCSAAVELLGLHAPTADINMAIGLSLITYFLVNYYGFKRKGFFGRIKSYLGIRPANEPGLRCGQKVKAEMKQLAKPQTIAAPFRILSDLVVPLSLSCRLFGNMFGGMVIVELLYWALHHRAVGIPSVAGLFFNVFHPLIQAFIFVTLTLSYIEEATAEE
ncbi:MAG: F0F1 ATP synthase subunit A [Oscillospiraceae bacterium]|jgi:F-type H+-transporting ATPase subunit a|nr:F0F1 ATP synthase subunit A [Oscillospiraceae bacterium]